MGRTMNKIKLLALATVTTGCLLTPAFALAASAHASPDQPKIAVKTSDLDLSTTAGQAALAHRVRRAAGEVCGSDAGETDRLEAHVRFTACVKTASDQAMTTAIGRATAQVAANR
jgi:UrcA family protein